MRWDREDSRLEDCSGSQVREEEHTVRPNSLYPLPARSGNVPKSARTQRWYVTSSAFLDLAVGKVDRIQILLIEKRAR